MGKGHKMCFSSLARDARTLPGRGQLNSGKAGAIIILANGASGRKT